jgi:3-oxoacyl-[acyl-carrier-protein] synthase II
MCVAARDLEGIGAPVACSGRACRHRTCCTINAHPTSAPAGDAADTGAARSALGRWLNRMPISATQSMTDHMVGGAEALEAVARMQALRTGVIPATAGLRTPDPACNLDYALCSARAAYIEAALSKTVGVGDHNTTLVFRHTAADYRFNTAGR